MILDLMVNAHKGAVFLFQPVINGVGGNLVSIQASRLSTALHQQTELGVLPDGIKVWITPWQAFFTDSKFIFIQIYIYIYMCSCICSSTRYNKTFQATSNMGSLNLQS